MSPTSLLALALMSGVLLGETLRPPAAPLAALAFLWLGVVAVAWRRGRGWGLATLGQVVLLGALATVTSWPRAPDGLLGGPPWVVTARVLEPPMEGADDAHVLLGLEEVARDGQAQEAAGRLWLRLGGAPKEPLLPGDRVLFRAQLRAPRGFAEPDAPDPARHFAARGLVAVAGLPAPEALVRLAGQERWCLGRPVARLRQRWLAWLRAELPSKGEAAGLMASLLLGERGAVSRSLERDFRVAGVSHVLSVSGLHLAIASFLLFIGLRRLLVWIEPLARRVAVRQVAALAALPAVVLYTLLTGAQVATVRACIVALLYLAGAALLRPAAAGSALAVAVLAILGASPLTLFDPSFQLSFAAALGGIVVAPRLPGRGFPSAGTGLGPRIVRGAFALVRVSLAALVTTAPITAWHFAQLGPAGLWANVLVVPLAELWVLPLGLGACVLGALPGGFGLFGALAHMLLALAAGGATFMIRAVRAIASVPGLAELGHVPPPTLLECAAWYGGLLALTLAGRRAWRVALLCGLVLGGSLAWRLVLAPRWDPALTVTFLDVGQGDAALVELPGGVTLLVDGGGSFDPSFDPGAQVLVPWLERHGVRRLDAVVLTHPHPDHANGLAAVVARFPTREVWTNGARSSLPGLLRLRDAAAERGVPIVRPHELVAGAARVEVLHPLVDGQVRVPPAWSENDGSIVLRILYGGRAVLLAGDIEARAEARLAQSGRALAADVLKAPHHGSRTSSTPRFVERVRPSVVVYSVGDQNRWGFPAPAVEARWRAAGARTYRTDRDGAVTVRIDTRGRISVRTARAFR
ncbi:MAG TPA: DNA internalization-related competence protein ComEC/Rec2 [Polyangia bacterium]|nr:DNA internalization-related competence protein ComEC/Rec2 [Polyangia bacterium]